VHTHVSWVEPPLSDGETLILARTINMSMIGACDTHICWVCVLCRLYRAILRFISVQYKTKHYLLFQ